MEIGAFLIKLMKYSGFLHRTAKWEQFFQGQQQNRAVRPK